MFVEFARVVIAEKKRKKCPERFGIVPDAMAKGVGIKRRSDFANKNRPRNKVMGCPALLIDKYRYKPETKKD